MTAVDYWPIPDNDDDDEQVPGQLPLDDDIIAAFLAGTNDDRT